MGISGYYRWFIKGYANIARSLTDLLKKDSFQWHSTTTATFQNLKQIISTAPVLRLPDFTKSFTLETDASGIGIGAVLSQDKHPIAYFSKKLSLQMQNKSAYVRKLYAVTEAVNKFRHYLFGNQFTIKTDQEAL